MNLAHYGHDAARRCEEILGAHPESTPGRIVAVRGDKLSIATDLEVLNAPALPNAQTVVGDWVAVEHVGGSARVVWCAPRRSLLSRGHAGNRTGEQPIAANVDTVFVVMGLDAGFNLRRVERLLVLVAHAGCRAVVVLTKRDLHPDPAAAVDAAMRVAPQAQVLTVDAPAGVGLAPLRAHLTGGATVAMVGTSGAGKSTLANALAGEEHMRTGHVRATDERGRHTTTHRELILIPPADGDPRGGGLLVDNPGVRAVKLWADAEDVAAAFHDITDLALGCRFRDCGHDTEPGCAVQAAVESGQLDAARLASWQRLGREADALDVRKRQARDRAIGRARNALLRTPGPSRRGRSGR